MSKILVKFHWDCGRMGDVNGLFVTTEEELKNVYGKQVYFGEILGKHSEIYGALEEKDFAIVSKEEDKIEWLEKLMDSKTISEYNPFDYLQEVNQVEEDEYDDEDYEE